MRISIFAAPSNAREREFIAFLPALDDAVIGDQNEGMSRKRITGADCQSCGACCGPPYVADTYITLSPPDVERLSPAQRRRLVRGVRRPAIATMMTRDGVVCAALCGRIGTRVSCSIYERRPGVCRRFEPGSRACLAMRRDVGIPEA